MSARPTKAALRRAFGLVVRELRIANGQSQEQLSFRAKVHRTYVGDLERGLKSPTLDVIDLFARALHVTPPDLIASVYKTLASGPRADGPPKRQRVRKPKGAS
ncbi:MAG TPA: helix-turn-helix transcriptional regulator [Gemmatimonadaceae bacterium]